MEERSDEKLEYILEEQEECELIDEFNKKLEQFYKEVEDDFNSYKTNPMKSMLSSFKQKYPFMKNSRKIQKNTDISKIKGTICTILRNRYFNSFTMNQKRHILNYCVKKIRGVYKHVQSKKTGYCNLQITSGILEDNTIMFCLTKNTLEANKQWSQRLIDNLKNKYSKAQLKKLVMVISHKKKGDEYATHFKNFDSACTQFHKESTFKIVFLCGNKTRINDVEKFAEFFGMFNDNNKLKKNIRILHDEAHNPTEGVPPYRAIIENILIKRNVLSYTPVSATVRPISEKNNPIWKQENLEKYALDYRQYDNTLSTDENYSSLSDANTITIEELKKHENWKNYNITKFNKKHYRKIYPEQSSNDVKIKCQLGFCQWPSIKDEKEEVNIGLNIINLNKIIDNHYESDKFNMHIISTRCRKIVIDYLAKQAIQKDYNPIVLCIYGGKVVIRYKKNRICKINRGEMFGECDSGEFNESLSKLFSHLKKKNITNHEIPKRPIIFIGNYKTTGESISFVNYKYGTVKSVTKLLPTNAEEDNQTFGRLNFMIDLFVEHNPTWKKTEKFIIGHEQSIDNALEYELENDQRIKNFETRDTNNISNMLNISEDVFNDNANDNYDNVSIPVKITVDRSEEGIKEILEITSKRSRSQKEKDEIMNILNKLVYDDESDCSIDDPTGKFDFNKFKLNQLRCYKKNTTRETKKSQYKFTSYSSHHDYKTPFMNDKNNHTVGECEITMCHDKYIVKKADKIVEENSKNIWWLTYKY